MMKTYLYSYSYSYSSRYLWTLKHIFQKNAIEFEQRDTSNEQRATSNE